MKHLIQYGENKMIPTSNASIAGRRFPGAAAVLFTALALLGAGGCGTAFDNQPSSEEKVREPDDKFDFIRRNDSVHYTDPESKEPDEVGESADTPTEAELDRMANALARDKATPEPEQSPARPGRAPVWYEDLITLDADEMLDVVLTFNSAPLVDTLPAFADILGFNFSADSDLKSTVTVNLNSRMTRRELWETFDQTLQLANAGAVRSGQLLQIMAVNKIPSLAPLRNRNRLESGGEVISQSLRNITAKDAVAQLKPFLTKSGVAAEVTRSNVVVVCDDGRNIAKLKEILELLDQPGRQNWPRTVVYCRNVKPSKLAQELSEIMPVLGLPVMLATDKAEVPGAIQLSSVDRLGILVATAATEEAVKEIRNWVELLDNADSTRQESMYIYKVAHGKAEQLAQALAVIFTTQGSTLTVDTSTGNDRTAQIATQTTRTATTANTNTANRNSTNNQTNTQVDLASNVFETPVKLFADGIHNRLVIRTTPRAYVMIKAMLDRLDVVPAQVLFQILVIEVNLNDGNEFGIQFNNVSYGGGTGVSTGTNFKDSGYSDANSEGFKLGVFDQNNPDNKYMFLRALATKENIKVISSPQLLVTSNTEATIQVGQSVPILTADLTNVDSPDGSLSRQYQYKDTGIILTLTPQITSTDLIALEIKQTVSEAVKNTITTAEDTPVINQRVLETAMTINNGRTMIIGGLIQEKTVDKLQSVPVIADIPFLRRLFGNTAQSVQRTEMLVMVTGYIINEKSPVEDMVKRYNNAVRALSLFEGDIDEENRKDVERTLRIKRQQVLGKPVTEL